MDRILRWLRGGKELPGLALGTLAFMVLVILWGAVVRATGSGAGCGDHWPLCNGDWVPRHPRLATVIEFTHRSMSGICTGLVAAVLAWTLLARPKGERARRAAVWSMGLLFVEALLGAVLVKGGYVEGNTSAMRVVMQGVHFTNTMLLLGALTLTWWWLRGFVVAGPVRAGFFPSGTVELSRTGRLEIVPVEKQILPLRGRMTSSNGMGVQWVALVATVVVGATGSVAALADTLFPAVSLRSALLQDFAANAPLLVRMRWVHPAAAAVGLACALWLGWKAGSRGRWLLVLIAVQIALGVGDVLLLAPTWMQVLHLLGADVYWIALVVACEGVWARAEAEAPHFLQKETGA